MAKKDEEVVSTETVTEEVATEKKEAVTSKKDTVTIDKKDYDKLLAMLDGFENLNKDVELLYRVSDKSRLAKELNKEGENLIREVNIRIWDNDSAKIVTGWSDLITNRSEIINGRWVEEQTTNVFFGEEDTMTVPYLEFVRRTINKIKAEIIGTTLKNGVTLFEVQFSNGKKMLIDSKFVN